MTCQHLQLTVVTAADARYAMPLAVMLRSLVVNAKPDTVIDLYILNVDIGWWKRKKIERSLRGYPININWTTPTVAVLSQAPISGHISLASYFRILAPDLLPPQCQRAVYLDADMVVEVDLADIVNDSSDAFELLAVQEGDWQLSSPLGLSFYQELGLPGDYPYLNAGFLVLDLERWRHSNYTAKALEMIRRYRDRLRWHDQDILNALFAGNWKPLDKSWNFRVCYERNRLSNANQVDSATIQPKILHYAGCPKPWYYSVYTEQPSIPFYKYLDQTAWKGWRPANPWLSNWLSKWMCNFRNRHYYGSVLRRIPLLGSLWSRMRPRAEKINQ